LNLEHFLSIKFVIGPSIDQEIAICNWYSIDVHLAAYTRVRALLLRDRNACRKDSKNPGGAIPDSVTFWTHRTPNRDIRDPNTGWITARTNYAIDKKEE
jgi:hypothetical protein